MASSESAAGSSFSGSNPGFGHGGQRGEHVTRRRKRRYVKPSIEAALLFRLHLHPSYIPLGGTESDRKPFNLRANTGRFCGQRCRFCDPCCEGNRSDFADYGSGVTVFFKGTKFLTWMMLIMSVFSVPAIVINTLGPGVSSSGSTQLTSSMLGDIAGASGGPSNSIHLYGKYYFPKQDAGLLYACCDTAACLLFVVAWLWSRYFERREDRAVDKATIKASDYTVYMPWVPTATTEDDIEELVKRAFHLDMHEYEDAYERGESGAKARDAPYEPELAEVHVVQDHMDIVNFYVDRGRIYRELERISERLRFLGDRIAEGDVGCCGYNLALTRRLDRWRVSLEERAESLSAQAAATAREGSVAAFVTFQRQEDAEFFLTRYPSSLGALCCQRTALQLRGRIIRVQAPPDPSGIIWGNLNVGFWSQQLRQLLTGVLTAVMLVGSFLLLWFASFEEQRATNVNLSLSCLDANVVAGLAANTINVTTVLANGNPTNQDVYCWCGTQPLGGLGFSAIEALPTAKLCFSYTCPALLAIDPAQTALISWCQPWFDQRASSVGLIVAAAVAVVTVNMIIAALMRVLTEFEGHHSFDALNASLALRLFFAQFFNTAVLMVIINANSQPFKDALPDALRTYEAGKYNDFSLGWYQNVGSQLLTTMLVNVLTPHIYPLCMFAFYLWTHRKAAVDKLAAQAKSQRDLNDVFVGPYNDFSLRYAQIYNTLFVCLIFSTGIPALVPIAFVSLFLGYWIDKMLFVYYNRRPPAFNTLLARTMSTLVPGLIVCKLAVGTWMISNVALFQDNVLDPLGVQLYLNLADRLFDAYADSYSWASARLAQVQVVPMLALLVLMVVAMLLRAIYVALSSSLRGAWHILTCGHCDPPKDIEGVDITFPLYREAVHPDQQDPARRIDGLHSYNILANPEIQSAFAIPASFAKTHKTLTDVALYRHKSLTDDANQHDAQDGQAKAALAPGKGRPAAAAAAAAAQSAGASAAAPSQFDLEGVDAEVDVEGGDDLDEDGEGESEEEEGDEYEARGAGVPPLYAICDRRLQHVSRSAAPPPSSHDASMRSLVAAAAAAKHPPRIGPAGSELARRPSFVVGGPVGTGLPVASAVSPGAVRPPPLRPRSVLDSAAPPPPRPQTLVLGGSAGFGVVAAQVNTSSFIAGPLPPPQPLPFVMQPLHAVPPPLLQPSQHAPIVLRSRRTSVDAGPPR